MPAVAGCRGGVTAVLVVLGITGGLLACGDDDQVATSGGPDDGLTSTPSSGGRAAAEAADLEATGAAQAAVEAWGRFADSGDLAQVAPHFHGNGPQFLRFQESAAAVAADATPPTGMVLVSPEVASRSDDNLQRVIRGTVVVSRPEQPDQRFQLNLVLFRAPDGAWRVWTMEDPAGRGGPVPAQPRDQSPTAEGPPVGYR